MNYKKMGVINITPNSFSDGNKFNQVESFEKKIVEVLGWADIIDIGAESTAPFNKEVPESLEIKRYEDVLFPFLEKTMDPKTTVSIDTYKIPVFKLVAEKISKHWPETKIIFNDISGKIDAELKEFLQSTKLKFTYVLSHNLCKKRSSTQKHMDFILKLDEKEFLKRVIEFFDKGMEELKKLDQDFIIDPCFGFSKSREQNQYLIKNFKTFLLHFSYETSVMYGVSRKSFLRFPANLDIKELKNQTTVDHIQSILIFDLLRENFKRVLVFRLHEPNSFNAAVDSKKIFDIF